MKLNSLIKYDYPGFNPNQLDSQNIDRLALKHVPNGSFVLEIGCATGFMGEYLIKEKNCQVVGLEQRVKEASVARKKLDKVVIADIEQKEAFAEIEKLTKEGKFDVILATSVMEHLKDPKNVLINLKRILKPNGFVIATIPNIAHWSMRIELLRGNFNYTDYGILDSTHLHFFTSRTFRDLFEKTGYGIETFEIDSVGGGYPKISRFLARFFPNLLAYQMLIVAKKRR